MCILQPLMHGNLSYKELKEQIEIADEFLAVQDIDFPHFVRTVIRSFEEYQSKHMRDKYEGNWMEFPKQELAAIPPDFQSTN